MTARLGSYEVESARAARVASEHRASPAVNDTCATTALKASRLAQVGRA